MPILALLPFLCISKKLCWHGDKSDSEKGSEDPGSPVCDGRWARQKGRDDAETAFWNEEPTDVSFAVSFLKLLTSKVQLFVTQISMTIFCNTYADVDFQLNDPFAHINKQWATRWRGYQ